MKAISRDAQIKRDFAGGVALAGRFKKLRGFRISLRVEGPLGLVERLADKCKVKTGYPKWRVSWR